MRKEIKCVLDSKALMHSLIELGYSIIYHSDSELEAKYKQYHFRFSFKRRRTNVHGHIDHGIFHDKPIYISPELEKEMSRIMHKYRKSYSKKTL
jgi:hypothetical protein